MQGTGFRVARLLWFVLLAVGPMNRSVESQRMVPVLVARQDVPAFAKLDEPEKWFKVVPYPMGQEPRDAVTDYAQVKDQRLGKRLLEDQVLRKPNIMVAERTSVVQLPESTRAIALPVDSGLTSLLCPGNRVDVAVVTTATGKGPTCKVVAEELQILANGCMIPNDSPQPTVVTVAATLPQCHQLGEASRVGKLHIVLRPPAYELAGDKPAWVAAVPSDLRGVIVRYNPTSLAGGFILPGSAVDVIVSKETSDKEIEAETLMQNLLVLAFDMRFRQDDKDGNCARVMLAVSKEHVEKLLAGTAEADVRLVPRSPKHMAAYPSEADVLPPHVKPTMPSDR